VLRVWATSESRPASWGQLRKLMKRMRSSSGMMTVVRDSANRRSRRFSPPGKAGDRPEKTTENRCRADHSAGSAPRTLPLHDTMKLFLYVSIRSIWSRRCPSHAGEGLSSFLPVIALTARSMSGTWTLHRCQNSHARSRCKFRLGFRSVAAAHCSCRRRHHKRLRTARASMAPATGIGDTGTRAP
jgi:hypothetical protein